MRPVGLVDLVVNGRHRPPWTHGLEPPPPLLRNGVGLLGRLGTAGQPTLPGLSGGTGSRLLKSTISSTFYLLDASLTLYYARCLLLTLLFTLCLRCFFFLIPFLNLRFHVI